MAIVVSRSNFVSALTMRRSWTIDSGGSDGSAPRIPQDDSKATYSTSAKRKHARINWNESAAKACRVMRAFTRPGKGAWTRLAGVRVYLWKGKVLQDEIEAQGAEPGTILGAYGNGVVVQAGDGQVLLKDTQVRPDGPSLLEHLGRLPGELPMQFV
jgi:methionyl-tRNA formyltransferase